MSELQVVEQVEVLVPLDRNKAEVLAGRIRRLAKQAGEQLVQVGRLLDQAQAGRVHETLGFPSWTAYVADALGGQLQLSGEARQAMVQLMAGEGMSVRAIVSATGASKSTVARHIGEVSHNGTPEPELDVSHDGTPDDNRASEPATVTGLDGKTYTKPKRKPKGDVDKAAPRRRSARKTIERVAPHLSGLAVAVSELDPGEVNAEELQAEIASIAESLGTIRKFVDGVGVPESAGRRPQVLTVFRDKVQDLAPIIVDLEELTKDSRWPKTAARFNRRDRLDLDATITALQNIRAAVGEVYNVTPTNDVITPEMLDTAADPVED
jgi:hypothetical protein